jgi:hypothetical protein
VNKETRANTRRGFLAAAGLGAAAAPIALHKARAQQKLPQAMIMYQPTPKDGQRCDNCLHWQPPNACAIVEGPIAPEGWCAAWAPKA